MRCTAVSGSGVPGDSWIHELLRSLSAPAADKPSSSKQNAVAEAAGVFPSDTARMADLLSVFAGRKSSLRPSILEALTSNMKLCQWWYGGPAAHSAKEYYQHCQHYYYKNFFFVSVGYRIYFSAYFGI